MKKALTCDDLAALYDSHAGDTARTKTIEQVVGWALNNPSLVEYDEMSNEFYLKG